MRVAVVITWLAGFSVIAAQAPPTGSNYEAAVKAASELPRLRSLLVSRRGELVLERYFNGARATQPANIKSASKSVISALTGIAIARGDLQGLDQPIADFFPELAKDKDPIKRTITIEDLLTMR